MVTITLPDPKTAQQFVDLCDTNIRLIAAEAIKQEYADKIDIDTNDTYQIDYIKEGKRIKITIQIEVI